MVDGDFRPSAPDRDASLTVPGEECRILMKSGRVGAVLKRHEWVRP